MILCVLVILSLNHDFYLVTGKTIRDVRPTLRRYRSVQIHDDLMRYIEDSLKWVPCVNRGSAQRSYLGLNLYGPNFIDATGSEVVNHVFTAWANLFRNGPRKLGLKGSWECTGTDPRKGKYQRIRVDRDEVVTKFEKVADFARQVSESRALYVLHHGI